MMYKKSSPTLRLKGILMGVLLVALIAPQSVVVEAAIDEGFETGNFNSYDWKFCSNGADPWEIDPSMSHSGDYSAQAGRAGSMWASCLQVALEVQAGEISFYYKKSSGAAAPFEFCLIYYLNGSSMQECQFYYSATGWTKETVSVDGGHMGFQWINNDASQAGIWVDDIDFPPLAQGGNPPNPPTDLNATASSSERANLSWNDNSGDEDGFKIYRKQSGGSYKVLDTVGANTESYSDTGVSCDTTYYYKVKAYNAYGASSFSNEDSATPPCGGTVPVAPTLVDINEGGTCCSPALIPQWQDNSSNESGFRVYRKEEAENLFHLVGTVGSNETEYEDAGLHGLEVYCYRIRAYNSAGNSSYSNELCEGWTQNLRIVKDEIFVKFEDWVSEAEIQAFENQYDLELKTDLGSLHAYKIPQAYYQNPEEQNIFDLLCLIEQDDRVKSSQPNFYLTIQGPGDINGNGGINGLDVLLVAEYLLDIRLLSSAQQEYIDVALPCGIINISDLLMISKVAIGLKTTDDFECNSSSSGLLSIASEQGIEPAKLGIEAKNIQRGQQGKIAISIEASPTGGISGIQIGPEGALTFNPSVIQVRNVRGVNGFQIAASAIDNQHGRVKFIALAPSKGVRVGKVIELEVEATGEWGHSTVIQISGPESVVDSEGDKLAVEVRNGFISIGEPQLEVNKVFSAPNPVRGAASARFIVEGMGVKEINVSIYDLSGRNVFKSGWTRNGFEWHLRNVSGGRLANGLYLYLVTIRGINGQMTRSNVKKLIILQ